MPEASLRLMKEGLNRGQSFASLMGEVGFAPSLVTQLELAEEHGDLLTTLGQIKHYLSRVHAVRKKLIEVSTYPILLLVFLVLIMLGLKNYLLPQMTSSNLASQLIGSFPTIFLGSSLVFLFLLAYGFYLYKKTSQLKLFHRLSQLPILGGMVQTYLTAYFAREWGSLLGQGLELDRVFLLMKNQSWQLFREMGERLETSLSQGQDFAQTLQLYPLFKPELALIIEYGQVKSSLGRELEVYADNLWKDFFYQLNRSMNLIQPLVFVFVAFMIVLLYAAMLLPIYQQMGV